LKGPAGPVRDHDEIGVQVGSTEFVSERRKRKRLCSPFNPNASVSAVRAGRCPIAVTVADNVLLCPQQLAKFGRGLEFLEDDRIYIPV